MNKEQKVGFWRWLFSFLLTSKVFEFEFGSVGFFFCLFTIFWQGFNFGFVWLTLPFGVMVVHAVYRWTEE